MTGGRLKRVAQIPADGETFCLTYGDGVADVDIRDLIAFHRDQGRSGTVTAVAAARALRRARIWTGDTVVAFQGEARATDGLGQRRVLRAFDRLCSTTSKVTRPSGSSAPLRTPGPTRTAGGFPHTGFWQPMDTLRDRRWMP